MEKTTEEPLQLLNGISENAIQWPSECVIIKKAATVNTQQPSQSEACDMCGGNHLNHECQANNHNDEHVHSVGYKSYPFESPMAQKHPGFQWSNPNGAENSQSFQKQKYKVTDKKMESQGSTLKNLEIQLSQIATLVSEKIQGPLPSNTEKNPKEHLKAIALRSGKDLDKPYADQSKQQIHINIPFTNALLQMPSYAKFLKELLSSKRKLEEVSVVMLTEKCSAILQNKLPQNLVIQFADQNTMKPKGIIEYVLVGVDKFVFPIDFIVLEMKECLDEPIILGRPFLATGREIIDVHRGQLILRVDEERVIFDMQKILRFSGDETSSSCFSIDMLNYLTDEFKDDQLIPDSMKGVWPNLAQHKMMILSSEEKPK
ncbi:PREDICTED: uncharacterized protein LOC109243982 [Nicotiana attenuata]|uniref:uncharacterized protein LOC109243982 n=1 Tax=Nicotiana attenuata TaxID=49451 RepID=UPI0009050A5F|nr:PREDICTED: uncharacterized protein LOC109243982 [Nicotiana attenuata]